MNDNEFRSVDLIVWLTAVLNDKILEISTQNLETVKKNQSNNEKVLKILENINNTLTKIYDKIK